MRPYGEIKNVSQKYETDVFHILVSLSGLVDAILVMIVDAILVMIVNAILVMIVNAILVIIVDAILVMIVNATLSSIKVRVFFGKSIEKSTCAVMIRILITFAKQIFL